MSLKIGGFLDYLGGDTQILNVGANTPTFTDSQIPEKYAGGTLNVAIKPDDTQETFVHRALSEHAMKAGLGKTEAKEFADQWTTAHTTFNHRANGESIPYTPKEFQNLKAKGTSTFDLTKEFDSAILADLNKRVDNNTTIKANPVYTPEERTAILQRQKGAGQNQSAIANKPDMMLTNGTGRDGKPLDAETALGRYIERNYNKNGRVWGDKINEMVSLAKTRGVQVDLKFNEDGTVLVNVNSADKQKLDNLFNQTLGETITGEQAGAEGQREATRMLLDQARVGWNSSVNIVEGTINTVIDAAVSKGGQDPLYSAIPEIAKPHVDFSGAKSKYESELMRRNVAGAVDGDGIKAGETIEAGVTIAAPIVIGAAIKPVEAPNTLKSLGALPEVRPISVANIATETTANQPVQSIKNKFPNDPFPTDGKIRGIAEIKNGKIKTDFQISTKQVDFVVDKKGNLILGKRHLTLASQGEVQAAGTLKIVDGKVKTITNLSGHYQPTIEEARKFPAILRKMGLDLKNTKLELSEFENTPSGYVIGNGKVVVNEYLNY